MSKSSEIHVYHYIVEYRAASHRGMFKLKLIEMKKRFKNQSLSRTSHISSAHYPRVSSGCCIGEQIKNIFIFAG